MFDLSDRRQFEDGLPPPRPAALRVARQRARRQGRRPRTWCRTSSSQLWRDPRSFDPARGSLRAYVTVLAGAARWTAGARARPVSRPAPGWRTRSGSLQAAGVEGADHAALGRERRRALLTVVARCRREQRDAILLAYGRGLTAREIAAGNGCRWARRRAASASASTGARPPRPRRRERVGWRSASCVARTGVSEGTLRMWERRHGFPLPERLPSGHRRYRESDVELVLRVVRERDSGLSLAAATARCAGGGGRARAVHLRRPAPSPARSAAVRPAQGRAPRAQPRHRGRELRARRAPAPLRLVSARALLPPVRSAAGATSPAPRELACVFADFDRPRFPRRRAGRAADRPLRAAPARVGGGVRGARPRGLPRGRGAASARPPARPRA